MEIAEYQSYVNQFSDYPKELGPFYLIYNLMSETGKLTDKLKNILNNNTTTVLSNQERYNLAISIGDLCKILCDFSKEIDISMDEIFSLNIKKLNLIKEKELKEKEIKNSEVLNNKV